MTSAADSPTFTAHLVHPEDARGGNPATLVAPGTKVVLNWNGPAGRHTLYSDREPQGEPVEMPHITGPLTRDSTFVLRTVLGSVTRHDSLTVTVDRPALPGIELSELAGGAELELPAGVAADGAVSVGGAASVTGGCTASGALTSTGPVKTGDLTLDAGVTGLDAHAGLVTDDMTVAGTTLTELSLTVTGGPVSVLRAPSFQNGLPSPLQGEGFVIVSNGQDGVKFTIAGAESSTTVADTMTAALPYLSGDRITNDTSHIVGCYVVRFGPEGTANP